MKWLKVIGAVRKGIKEVKKIEKKWAEANPRIGNYISAEDKDKENKDKHSVVSMTLFALLGQYGWKRGEIDILVKFTVMLYKKYWRKP